MSQSEFVFQLDTEASEDDVRGCYRLIGEIVEDILDEVESEKLLEDILRDTNNSEYLSRNDLVGRERPESFTEERIIEPLFEELGYQPQTMARHPGDLSDERGEEADYAVQIGDERILIEAEPLNKNLEWKNVGIDQVKSWLENRQFDANYGIATDGLRWVFLKYNEDSYGYETLADIDLRAVFIHQFERLTGRTSSLTPFSEELQLDTEFTTDLEQYLKSFDYANIDKIVAQADRVITVRQNEITEEFYEDYIRLIFGVLDEEGNERTKRCLIKSGVQPPSSVPAEKAADDVRLFSVSLMNRLVFIKFLEDKGIVQRNLLQTLKEEHEEGAHPGSFYETFIKPLFYDIFNSKKPDRNDRAKRIDLYKEIPYLNGGLFTETVDQEEGYKVDDEILKDIIILLEGYDFSTNGGYEALDPSILGNVFEKTINYLAGEVGRQKELGAYYTPDSITRFCAEHTVQPALLQELKGVLEERGWEPAEIEQFESTHDLIDAIVPSQDLIDDLLEEVDSFTVLDPAAGSGHFLTSVLGEITNIRKELHRKRGDEFSEMMLKRQTVMNNIYGVDIVPPAVEIAKLRLWLAIISELKIDEFEDLDDEELALPNITFNVRQGNSLIGFSRFQLRNGGPQMKLAEVNLLDTIPKYKQQVRKARHTHHGLEELLGEIEALRGDVNQELDTQYLQLVSDFEFEDEIDSFDDGTDAVEQLRNRIQGGNVSKAGIYVDEPLTEVSEDYISLLEGDLGFASYKWKANLTLSGQFDEASERKLREAIDNHPNPDALEKIFIERGVTQFDLESLDRFHWLAEFPEAISLPKDEVTESPRFGFDVLIGNPPFTKSYDGLYKSLIEREEFYECQKERDLAEQFLERGLQLCRKGGRLGFVIPKSVAYYDSWSEMREKLFSETDIKALFDNGLAFRGVDYEQMTMVVSPQEKTGRELQ